MRIPIILVGALGIASCSGFIDSRAADSTYKLVIASDKKARTQADVMLAREAMPGGVTQLAGFTAAYPEHAGFRALYADAICGFALGFIYDDWDAATLAGRGADADAAALRLHALIPECIDENLARLVPARRLLPPAALAPEATVDEVPALTWIAQAEAVQLALDPLVHLAELPGIVALLERCAALAPGANDGAAELVLATIAGSRPTFAGGDGGEVAFARARKAAGDGVLIVDVLAARTGAVTRKDRAAFAMLLRGVLDVEPTRWPERRLANELARLKARRYLAAIDTLIPAP